MKKIEEVVSTMEAVPEKYELEFGTVCHIDNMVRGEGMLDTGRRMEAYELLYNYAFELGRQSVKETL